MKKLFILAALQAILYGGIAWQSSHFADGRASGSRPLILVLGLFGAAFLLYALSLRIAVKVPKSKFFVPILITSSLIYRALLLPTPPIQEIDIYRYLWDGAVTANGLSPYRVAPVLLDRKNRNDRELMELKPYWVLCDHSLALQEAVFRIHYPELTTIYPPVSQAVFAVGHLVTPDHASLNYRLITLKAVLLLFDMGTILLLLRLLKRLSWHLGGSVAYAWCPLVIKEFANTGHLDSIAVFFSIAAALALIIAVQQRGGFNGGAWNLLAAILLSAAIGAKLYPLVLLPIFFALMAAHFRLRTALASATIVLTLSLAMIWPMLFEQPFNKPLVKETFTESSVVDPALVKDGQTFALRPPPLEVTVGAGLSTFLSRWEMNDWLFMLIIENLRPEEAEATVAPAWFAVTPNAARLAVITPVAQWLVRDLSTTSFLLTRIFTLGVLVAIVVVLARRVYRMAEGPDFLEACFLVLAWLWLLAPTQNPWYWTWVVPFLHFARSRAWHAVAGLSMLYYLRFWLIFEHPDPPAFGTPYSGARFFDFVVVPLEFLPWLIVLAMTATLRTIRASHVAQSNT